MIEQASLKSKAVTASLWAIVEKFSLTASQFIVGIILARLLDPVDFGLIALTTIMVATLSVITDGGFESVIIQTKILTTTQVNTIFYINVAIGILMCALQYFAAPVAANFFNEPKLTGILRWLCLVMPLEALGQTQRTLLMKELKFKKISLYQIISSIVSGLAGILLAYNGFGVMALVFSVLIALCVRSALLWIKSDWYPNSEFSYSSIFHLVPNGINVMVTSIILFFMQEFNTIIIGKFYTQRDLGLYNRGLKFPDLVTGIIQGVVLKLSLPMFSKIQDQNDRLQILIKRTNSTISSIIFPLLLLLFINANEIILLLLTKKWMEAVIYLKLFCAVKLLDPYINVQRNVLIAKDKSKVSFRLSLITCCAEVFAILLLAKYGMIYIISVVIVSRVLQYMMYGWLCSRIKLGSIFINVKQIAVYLIMSAGVVLGVQFLNKVLFDVNHYNAIHKLITNTIFCGVLYLTLWIVFRKEDVLFARSVLHNSGFNKMKLSKA